MVAAIRNTEDKMKNRESIDIDEAILGDGKIELTQDQKELMRFTKRKIFAIQTIKKGEALTKDNIAVLRPGNRNIEEGLHPKEYSLIIGGLLSIYNRYCLVILI